MTVIETGTVPPSPVRIFCSPGRYVQGDGVIDLAGEQLVALGLGRCAVLLSERSQKAEGQHNLCRWAGSGSRRSRKPRDRGSGPRGRG